mgnify:CR=1 FL=1
MARVTLLEKDQADPIMQTFYQLSEDAGFPVLNFFKALAHSPKLARDFLRLGTAILGKADLSPVLRELAILRIGHVNQAHYEWTQHVRIGQSVGLTMEKINAVKDWLASDLLDETEKAVLAYTDEVNVDIRVADACFDQVKQLLGEKQVVELTVTIAYYGAVSRILESLDIELEDDL